MAKHEFLTSIDIDVPAAAAWAVLVDFDAYSQWCPTHREIRGSATLGTRLHIRLAREPGSDKTLSVPATVRQLDPGRAIAFGGGFPGAPWLFDIHHWFQLEPLSADSCRFHNGERFQGLLLSLVWSTIAPRVEHGYAAFNTAFKQRCEATARPTI